MSGTNGFKPDDSISLDSRSELPADSGQFDLTAYAVALAFNSVAPPPGMSQGMRATIEARARDIRTTIDQAPAASEFTDAGAREKRRRDADERTEVQVAADHLAPAPPLRPSPAGGALRRAVSFKTR